MKKRNVGIYIFEKVEVLDFAGPFEVFSVASELHDHTLFNVFTFAEKPEIIKAVNGLQVKPDYDFTNCPDIDILCIPGGNGTRAEIAKQSVLNWFREKQTTTELTFSVCSGAMLLAKLALLDGLTITTHHEVIPDLEKLAPSAVIDYNARFTDNGDIFTAGGISAGIDLSLYLVEKLQGKKVADTTRIYMEYGNWRELNG
jgi:transcriptional regulator GlxA family with amidase domain